MFQEVDICTRMCWFEEGKDNMGQLTTSALREKIVQ